MKGQTGIRNILLLIGFIACLLPAVIFSYKHPAYNFDILGYMALVLDEEKQHSPEELHRLTYAEAKRKLPEAVFLQLTDSTTFRGGLAKDPAKFSSLLPIYQVKPLYILLAYAAYRTGIPLDKATVMPSLLAFLLTGALIFYWLSRYLGLAKGFVAAFLLMYSVFSINLAALSTPDYLSAFFFLSSLYFILENRNFILFLLLALAAVFSRLDNVINYFFILSFFCFHPRWKWIPLKQYLLALTILGASYIFIIMAGSSFDWNFFNYFDYAKRIDFSRNFDQAYSLGDHFGLMVSKLATAMISSHFSFFLFLAVLIMAFPGTSLRKPHFPQAFTLLLIAVILLRFLLLPDLSDRFYFSFYILLILMLVRMIKGKYA